jgi:ATP-dependent Clp protease ATP-binding subunit ClpA
MNELFSESARKAIELARDEANRLGHDWVGTEHLLLGIIRQGENRALEVFEQAGVTLLDVVKTTEEIVGYGTSSTVLNPPLTARAKKDIEISGYKARALKSQLIEPEHILLALLKDEDGVATQVLGMFDIDYREAYVQITGMPDPRIRLEFSFSEAVRNVLQGAFKEARRLQNSCTGITHIFLGLMLLQEDPAMRLLIKNKLDLNQIQSFLEQSLQPDPEDDLRIDYENLKVCYIAKWQGKHVVPPQDRNFEAAIKYAMLEARKRGLREIDTLCLLLAILGFDNSSVAITLSRYGVTYKSIQSQLEQTT